jgi:hypothetical protein
MPINGYGGADVTGCNFPLIPGRPPGNNTAIFSIGKYLVFYKILLS